MAVGLRLVSPGADLEMRECVKVLGSVTRKYQEGHGEVGQDEKGVYKAKA